MRQRLRSRRQSKKAGGPARQTQRPARRGDVTQVRKPPASAPRVRHAAATPAPAPDNSKPRTRGPAATRLPRPLPARQPAVAGPAAPAARSDPGTEAATRRPRPVRRSGSPAPARRHPRDGDRSVAPVPRSSPGPVAHGPAAPRQQPCRPARAWVDRPAPGRPARAPTLRRQPGPASAAGPVVVLPVPTRGCPVPPGSQGRVRAGRRCPVAPFPAGRVRRWRAVVRVVPARRPPGGGGGGGLPGGRPGGGGFGGRPVVAPVVVVAPGCLASVVPGRPPQRAASPSAKRQSSRRCRPRRWRCPGPPRQRRSSIRLGCVPDRLPPTRSAPTRRRWSRSCSHLGRWRQTATQSLDEDC